MFYDYCFFFVHHLWTRLFIRLIHLHNDLLYVSLLVLSMVQCQSALYISISIVLFSAMCLKLFLTVKEQQLRVICKHFNVRGKNDRDIQFPLLLTLGQFLLCHSPSATQACYSSCQHPVMKSKNRLTLKTPMSECQMLKDYATNFCL